MYIQLIYNPVAGHKFFPVYLDKFIEVFQSKGYEVRVFRTSSSEDFSTFLKGRDMSGCAAIFVAGGDGSINRIVNAMFSEEIELPLGVIPSGTANDFAKHLNLPLDTNDAIEKLAEMQIGSVDLGKVNDSYFINVCCGGLFANISQNMDIELKNTLGKLAYYIKGVQQLPRFKRLKFKIEYDEGTIEDYFYLFLILNGSSAGGFSKLGQSADIRDGLMDFVGIKACTIVEMPNLFRRILMGEHLNDKNIVFFKSKHIKIDCIEGNERFDETDIDGEAGPNFPLTVDVLYRKLKVIVSK